MPPLDDQGSTVETPLAKVEHLLRLRCRAAQLDRLIAEHAPARVRPWHSMARDTQLPPRGGWNIWLFMGGRGTGKTATGSQWIAEQAARNPNTDWAIVAPTWRDCKIVCLEGRSGLLQALLPGELASINSSELTVRLTNGSRIFGYSADGFERLRGQNLSGAWVDEAAVMAQVDDMFAYALMPALRIGERPRVLITTTPRPIKFLKNLLARTDGSVTVTRGTMWDNAANLSPAMLAELRAQYEGTRAGKQELEGELLEEIDGAYWSHDLLDQTRVMTAPAMARIVVAIDPATTSGEKSDFTGIVVAGRGVDGHFYILEDLTFKGSPNACMKKAVAAYHAHQADRIVAETNNGGDYLENVLRQVDENVAYTTVRATRGKSVRAEPISALWEQGRGHIVGSLPELEDQMASCTPPTQDEKGKDRKNKDPDDRLDAMIYAATELQVGASAMLYLSAISKMCPSCDMPNMKRAMVCAGCGTQLPDAEAA